MKLTGQMKYQADPNRPMLETVSVAGNVSSAGLDVKTPSLQTEVRDLYARYQLSGGNAEVKDIRARIMGGTLSGKLTIKRRGGRIDSAVAGFTERFVARSGTERRRTMHRCGRHT